MVFILVLVILHWNSFTKTEIYFYFVLKTGLLKHFKKHFKKCEHEKFVLQGSSDLKNIFEPRKKVESTNYLYRCSFMDF
jgi:hypothetical protein